MRAGKAVVSLLGIATLMHVSLCDVVVAAPTAEQKLRATAAIAAMTYQGCASTIKTAAALSSLRAASAEAEYEEAKLCVQKGMQRMKPEIDKAKAVVAGHEAATNQLKKWYAFWRASMADLNGPRNEELAIRRMDALMENVITELSW